MVLLVQKRLFDLLDDGLVFGSLDVVKLVDGLAQREGDLS